MALDTHRARGYSSRRTCYPGSFLCGWSTEVRKSIRALACRAVVAVGVVGLAPVVGSTSQVFAYVAQNCGNQTISTASQSTTLQITSIFTSGCGMKAAIYCRYSNGTGDTGLLVGGLATSPGGTSAKSCPTGKVGYQWGHQEGVNW